MRILVASARVPLAPRSYADRLAAALAAALVTAGHDAEHLTVPFNPEPPSSIADGLLFARLLELDRASTGRVDRLIALDFPATAIRHDRKVLWLAGLARPAAPGSEPIGTHEHPNLVAAMRASDRGAARDSRAVFAVSGALAARWAHWSDTSAVPLLPLPLPAPPLSTEPMTAADHRSGAGIARTALARPTLARLALGPLGDDATGTGPVVLLDRDADHDEAARAAMAVGRPVVCCTDAGAPLDLVLDGVTGAVVPPDPGALRAVLELYRADPVLARTHGAAGQRRLASLLPDWSGPIERLLD